MPEVLVTRLLPPLPQTTVSRVERDGWRNSNRRHTAPALIVKPFGHVPFGAQLDGAELVGDVRGPVADFGELEVPRIGHAGVPKVSTGRAMFE